MLVLYLSIFFLVVALALFIIVARQKSWAGIPAGRVIYTDSSHWGKVEKPLFDPRLHLSGKPDYLVQQGKQVIPVEVKSSSAPVAPYDAHIYQLAAYCLLVAHEFGTRPNHGIIHYPNRTFSVDFSSTLESSVKAIIGEMQGRTTHVQVDRSHENPRICQHCGYRSICDQSLRI